MARGFHGNEDPLDLDTEQLMRSDGRWTKIKRTLKVMKVTSDLAPLWSGRGGKKITPSVPDPWELTLTC